MIFRKLPHVFGPNGTVFINKDMRTDGRNFSDELSPVSSKRGNAQTYIQIIIYLIGKMEKQNLLIFTNIH